MNGIRAARRGKYLTKPTEKGVPPDLGMVVTNPGLLKYLRRRVHHINRQVARQEILKELRKIKNPPPADKPFSDVGETE